MSGNGQTACERIAVIQEFLSSLREVSKPFPSIDYWLRVSQKETVRIIDGRPTKTADLPGIIAACPSRSSLQQIEARLQGLHSVAAGLGLRDLAGKIEAASRQAHHDVKARRR